MLGDDSDEDQKEMEIKKSENSRNDLSCSWGMGKNLLPESPMICFHGAYFAMICYVTLQMQFAFDLNPVYYFPQPYSVSSSFINSLYEM